MDETRFVVGEGRMLCNEADRPTRTELVEEEGCLAELAVGI